MSSRPLLLLLACALLFAGCGKSTSKRTAVELEKLRQKTAAEAKEKEQRAKEKDEKLAALPEVVKLDPPYDDATSTRLRPDGPCPEGLWALFPGEAPGATPAEKKANQAKRKELAAALKGQKFMVLLRAPDQVTLKPYDAPNGTSTTEVWGAIDCADSFGHVTVAWTDAKAVDPGASAAKQGAELTQNVWQAPPVVFTLPIKTMAEAKAYEQKHRIAMAARVVFTLDAVKVDRKMKRVEKVAEEAAGEKLSFGGGMEDWGAGRMVKAKLVALRVAVDKERTQLFEKR